MKTHSTVAALLLDRARATPDALAFQYPVNADAFAKLTWSQTSERVGAIAAGLTALGLEPEQRCAIVSSTRIEWILADLAVLCAGGATTTVYPSSDVEESTFILSDSESVIAFVENEAQLAKLRAKRHLLPKLRKAVLFEGTPAEDWVMPLAELEALGRAAEQRSPGGFEARARAVAPQQLATLMYTSGTTGRPKGVRLSHDGWVYQAEAAEALKLLSPSDHQLLWLPLSHAFGKVLEVCAMRIGFATTVDGRVERLMENLARVQPTFMGAPPRIFEKIYGKLLLAADEGGVSERALVSWALGVARQVTRARQEGKALGVVLRTRLALADKLVFAKIRRQFGGRMRFLLSGSAPLSRELAEVFHAAGLLILEGYGLTETCAGAVLNGPEGFRFGSVGKPNPGTELCIAPDGEILLRSRGVMLGYHGLPEESRAVLTSDGWLHTGDIGVLDEHGYLFITERKKDLIKTSTGLYVAPQKVEALVKAQCPYVGHVVVHGDRRSYCSALIALDADAIKKWAAARGAGDEPYASLAKKPEVRALIEPAIERVNASLTSHEAIRRFALLSEELTIQNGLLTPSMKLRRREAELRYERLLDRLYDSVPSPKGATEEPQHGREHHE